MVLSFPFFFCSVLGTNQNHMSVHILCAVLAKNMQQIPDCLEPKVEKYQNLYEIHPLVPELISRDSGYMPYSATEISILKLQPPRCT